MYNIINTCYTRYMTNIFLLYALDDFDIILGMDWLVRYMATIDCRKKMVTFEPEGEDPFVFAGTMHGPRIPMISALRASDLL